MLQILAQYSSNSNVQVNSGAAAVGVLFMLVIIVAVAAFMIFVWGTIFKKAGYSFWMALLMIIPLVNLIWMLIFAFSKWPIQQELEALRGGGYTGGAGFPTQPPPMR